LNSSELDFSNLKALIIAQHPQHRQIKANFLNFYILFLSFFYNDKEINCDCRTQFHVRDATEQRQFLVEAATILKPSASTARYFSVLRALINSSNFSWMCRTRTKKKNEM
jgi:hypothetical protein